MASGIADVYLPRVRAGVGMLAFHRVAEVAARGYGAAREPVAAWAAGRAVD